MADDRIEQSQWLLNIFNFDYISLFHNFSCYFSPNGSPLEIGPKVHQLPQLVYRVTQINCNLNRSGGFESIP